MSEEESVAIELIVAQTPTLIITDKKQREALLEHIGREVDSFVPDVSTKKGRDAIAALAYKVSRTKTAIDLAGQSLKSEWLEKSKAVDESRRKIRDELDIIRDRARKPLEDWEETEKIRMQKCKATLDELADASIVRITSAEFAEIRLRRIKDYILDKEELREFYDEAASKRDAAISALESAIIVFKKTEADAVELSRLRAESASREAADRETKRVADEKIAAEKREAEEKSRLERVSSEAAERSRKDAERKAKEEADQVERERQQEAERVKREHQDELNRLRMEKELEDIARRKEEEKREAEAAEGRRLSADRDHRIAVREAIVAALVSHSPIDDRTADKVFRAIADGMVPNVAISWGVK